MPPIEPTEFQPVTEDGAWRVIDGRAHAWFEASSHAAGADLVRRLAADGPLPDIDLRSGGLRVRLGGHGEAEARRAASISAAAREMGLRGDPSVLQAVDLVVESTDPATLVPFWSTVLGYRPEGDRLVDPWRRDPSITLAHHPEARLLRNRLHVDVVRPSDAVAAAVAELGQVPGGPYGVLLSDPDGNEADLVPGSPIPGGHASDWVAAFAAMAAYPTKTPQETAELVTAVARSADGAGIPMLVDVRSEGVLVDSGKDMWEAPDGPLEAFVDLAAAIQAASHGLGLAADPVRPRFVQLCLDIADLSAERSFWASVLGYEADPREGVVDIFDPRRLSPVLIFQRIDTDDVARRRQRDRIRMVLHVPPDRLEQRIDAAISAGGSISRSRPGKTRLRDPEGNELELVYAP